MNGSAESSPRSRRVYRQRWFTFVVGAILLGGGIAVGAALTALYASNSELYGVSDLVFAWVASFALILVGGLWMHRRLVLDSSTARVVGLLRTRRIPLEQIAMFNVEPFVLRAVCVIHLREGGRVPVFALTFVDPALSTTASYEPLIAELNSALGSS